VTKWGGKPLLVPSGHSIIKHAMHTERALLGGELSCHFFFADRYFGYDDGIYAALRLVELLTQSPLSLQERIQQLPTTYATPEFRFACAEEVKSIIVEQAKIFLALRADAELLTIDGIRATFPYGWGLLRASNTQAFISIRCESLTFKGLMQVKQDFYQLLIPYLEKKVLHSLLGE
jgi:phosphomannomutase